MAKDNSDIIIRNSKASAIIILSQLKFKPRSFSHDTNKKNRDLPNVMMDRYIHRQKKNTATTTTTNTKIEHGDKVVTRMTSHALDDPEDGESSVVALFYGSLPDLFGL